VMQNLFILVISFLCYCVGDEILIEEGESILPSSFARATGIPFSFEYCNEV
jgi:hypothetical protein